MQVTYPDGIQPLVVNAKWSQKPSRRDRHVGIHNVVDLQVINIFSDNAFVRAVAVLTLKLTFECRPCLNQPAICPMAPAAPV